MTSLGRGIFAFWATVHHYLTFWPRLRVALGASLVALVALPAAIWLLRVAQRRTGFAMRAVRRFGGAGLVFGGTLLVLVSSAGGHLYTPDEWTIYAAAAGLVNHGAPAAFADEPYPLYLLSGPIRPRDPALNERLAYSKYGAVPSLLAAPLYAVARLAGQRPDLPQQAFPYGNRALPLVPLVLNPLATAATAAMVFQVAVWMGYRRGTAALTAAAFAFGSLAWPYSKTLLNGPLAAAFLFGGFTALFRARAAGGRLQLRWAVAAGAAFALAVATRTETAPLAALLALLVVRPRDARGSATAIGGLAAGGLAFGLPLVAGWNLYRTGSLFDFGYGNEGLLSSLDPKPWYGLFGILLSPGCGLAVHTPLMVLGLVALVWLWEDSRAAAMACAAVCGLAILYYGSLNTWCGYTAWGPRYLVLAGPFMALPLAALWQRIAAGPRNPFAWLIAGGLFAWSAGLNLLAVLIDWNRGWQDHWALGVTYLEITWLPYFSGITAHLRLLREWLMDGAGGLDLYLWHALGPAGPPVTFALLAAGALCYATVWLAPELRQPGLPAQPARPVPPIRRTPTVTPSAVAAPAATPPRPAPAHSASRPTAAKRERKRR